MPKGGQYSGTFAGKIITADLNYYVRTDGNDNNDGLANTAGRAFKTPQKAVDVMASILNLYGYSITTTIKAGTYIGQINLRPYNGGGGLYNLWGDGGAVVINYDNNIAGFPDDGAITSINTGTECPWNVQNLTLNATSLAHACIRLNNARMIIAGMRFQHAADYHIDIYDQSYLHMGANNNFDNVTNVGSINVEEGSTLHAPGFGGIGWNGSLIWNGAQAYAGQVISVIGNSYARLDAAAAITGAAVTGKRYAVSKGSMLFATPNTIPGSVAGTVDASSIYV